MPLVIDGFCGLGGWAEGFLAENYDVVGFDTVRHDYGTGGYPGQLVLQDWLTLDGAQFKNAACIVASPPCQEFSYMAMPWSRAKQIARALRGEDEFPEKYEGSRTLADLTALFDACFRIQREASAAAGRHVPMVVENVKGAQPWVGMAKAHYGSFYLWGDVESVGGAVVGSRPRFGETLKATRRGGKGKTNFHFYENTGLPSPSFHGAEHEPSVSRAVEMGSKKGFVTGLGLGHDWRQDPSARFNSKSDSRKAASAQIAKIPFLLAQHIARIYKP